MPSILARRSASSEEASERRSDESERLAALRWRRSWRRAVRRRVACARERAADASASSDCRHAQPSSVESASAPTASSCAADAAPIHPR
eukprot:scaffold293635_cov21-Tisochrysis_lutea.AAC.1